MEYWLTSILDPANQIHQILISIFLGVFVGLRREMWLQRENQTGLMGMRTLPMIALLGTVSTFFTNLPYLPVLFFVGVFVFILIAYWNGVFKLKKYGLTSELLSLMMFWVGVLIGYEKILLSIVLTVVLAIFTAYKNQFHNFAKKLAFEEWSGALQLIIITAVMLPFLPKEPIDKYNLLIPYDVWLLVIFISTVGFVGYFLQKFFGKKKSVLLTSALGSIVSSTAVTISLGEKSKQMKNISLLTSAVMLSIVVMQLRIILEIVVASGGFVWKFITPSIVMSVVGFLFFLYFYHFGAKKNVIEKDKIEEKIESPLKLIPAIKFALLFVVILYVIFFGQKYFEHIGGYIVSALAAVVDSDAIVLSNIESYKTLHIDIDFVANMISIVVIVNTLVKIFYLYVFSKKELLKKTLPAILVISFFGFITFLIS